MKLLDPGLHFMHGSSQAPFQARILIQPQFLLLLHDGEKMRLVLL